MLTRLILIAITALFTANALALTGDHRKPAYISADKFVYHRSQHKLFYQGHVDMKQGTSQLTANKVLVYLTKKNKLKEMIATGHPAFHTLPQNQKQIVYAHADTIKYFPTTGNIDLIGHATIRNGTNSFVSDFIRYNNKTQTAYSKAKKHNRIHIIIHPQTLHQ